MGRGFADPRAMCHRTPVECGDLPFLIRRDGTWMYRGSAINRKELVCLFASVLKRDEDGAFWLETPAERGKIEVEDAPFVAVELDWAGEGRRQVLSFRTNVDQVITAGADHPIRISHDLLTCEPTPYSTCAPAPADWRSRRASPARCITSWWHWGSRAGSSGRRVLGVWSCGTLLLVGRVVAWRRLSPASR